MKIKKFNENDNTNYELEEAKEFVCEYIKNGDHATMPEYFEFFFGEKRGVKTELIKNIKALCSNLGLDANEL